MNSTCHYYGPPNSNIFRFGPKVSDDDHLAVVASQSLAQDCFPYLVLGVDCAYFVEELAAVAVGVGVAVGEVDLVEVVLKRYLEGQRVVKTTSFLLHSILIVADVKSISDPPR